MSLLVGLCVLLGATFWVAVAASAPARNQASPVKIGAFVWTQGTLKTFGDQSLAGIRLAVDQINKSGGILHGRKVQLKVYEEGLDAATTTNSLRQAKADGVVGLVGFADATAGTVAASVSDRLGLPIVIAGSGSGTFVKNNKRADLVHVLLYPEAYVPGEAAWAKKQGFKSVAQVAYDSSYSRVDEAAWRRELQGTGITFPSTVYVPYGQSDASAAVAKAVAAKPDMLIFDIWGSAVVGGLKRLAELNFPTAGHTIQSDVSMVDQDMQAAGPAACGFADTEQFFPEAANSASLKFVAALKKDQPGAVLGGQTETFYEGATILLKGIDKAGTTSNRAAIGKGMRSVNFMTPRGVKMEILPTGQVYVSKWYMVSWDCSKNGRKVFQVFNLPKSYYAPSRIITKP